MEGHLSCFSGTPRDVTNHRDVTPREWEQAGCSVLGFCLFVCFPGLSFCLNTCSRTMIQNPTVSLLKTTENEKKTKGTKVGESPSQIRNPETSDWDVLTSPYTGCRIHCSWIKITVITIVGQNSFRHVKYQLPVIATAWQPRAMQPVYRFTLWLLTVQFLAFSINKLHFVFALVIFV